MQKRCSKCKQSKDVSEFHRNKVMYDGYANQCISCFRETHKKYRDSEKGKNTYKSYSQSERGQIAHAAANKRYKKTDASKASYADYYKRCKQKNRARGRVFDLVRDGKIQPASDFQCAICGKPAIEYHHHNGYDDIHSLDVIPLCKSCHINADKSPMRLSG